MEEIAYTLGSSRTYILVKLLNTGGHSIALCRIAADTTQFYGRPSLHLLLGDDWRLFLSALESSKKHSW